MIRHVSYSMTGLITLLIYVITSNYKQEQEQTLTYKIIKHSYIAVEDNETKKDNK